MSKGDMFAKIVIGVFGLAFLILAIYSGFAMYRMSTDYHYSGAGLTSTEELIHIRATVEAFHSKWDIAGDPIYSVVEYNNNQIGFKYSFYSAEMGLLDFTYYKDSNGNIASMLLPLLLAGALGVLFVCGAICWRPEEDEREDI